MAEPTQRTVTAGAFLVSLWLVELLRTLLPSVLVVLPERTGLTTGLAITWAGLVLVGVPPAAAVLAARGTRSLWVGAAIALLLARGLLLADPGLEVRAATSTLGVAGGLTALVALAAGSPSGRAVRVGILLGIGTEAALRVATAGTGLVWSTGVAATWTTLALGVLLVALLRPTRERLLDPARDTGPPAWPWWWLLPALVLTSTVTAPAGRLAVATDWPVAAVAATSATVQGAAVLAALLAPRLAPTRAAVLGGTSILVGVAAALPAVGVTGVLGPLLTAVGLGAIAGLLAGAGKPSSGRQRARVAGMALAGAGLVLLLHGLGPGFGLGTTRRILLLLLALVAVALSAVASRRASYVTVRRRLRPQAGLVVVLLAAAVAGAAALAAASSSAPQERPRDATLTLATFNARAGFGPDGRFDPERQGALLAAEDVDLVLVNEVDRGWWLTGGQDLLPGLAAALGLEHVTFVPAADEVNGHALLSRYPISEVSSAALPGGDRQAPRSQLAAIVEVSQELDLGIVGAQLLPGGADEEVRLAQARALAGTVARLRERALPTVVLGDLGVREGTTILETLDPLVTSALPENSTTYPSWQPVDQRDHVLLSPELRRASVRTPATVTSSHLPVVVTVEVRRPVL